MSHFIMSFSCGKDSTLALYRMMRTGHTPVALLVTMEDKEERSFFHGIPREMVETIADSLDIPLLLSLSWGENYEERFEASLQEGKAMGADTVVYGDIDILEHRMWGEEMARKVGLKSAFPLWGGMRDALTNEVIEAGFKAMIKNINLEKLPQKFLGEFLTPAVVQGIVMEGSDPCGENGEYHTVVLDGPLFRYPIGFIPVQIQVKGPYASLDLVMKNERNSENENGRGLRQEEKRVNPISKVPTKREG